MQTSHLIKNLTAGKKQTVVAYGTSLTAGGQWVQDLQIWLDGRHPGQARVINAGMGGKASNSGLAHLKERVLVHDPDMVLLEFAVNDASIAYEAGDIDGNISLQQSRANLNRIIDLLVAANSSIEIILQTMNPPWDAPNGNRSASRRPYLADYYEGYRKVAAGRSLPLIDHFPNWLQLQKLDLTKFKSYIPDGVHPNAEGSTAVTFQEIARILSTSS